MINAARGEAALMIDGKQRRLCLTLGALAEMESAFACASLEALAQRLKTLSAKDVLIVLAALLRGGGERQIDVNASRVDLVDAANAIADCFASLA